MKDILGLFVVVGFCGVLLVILAVVTTVIGVQDTPCQIDGIQKVTIFRSSAGVSTYTVYFQDHGSMELKTLDITKQLKNPEILVDVKEEESSWMTYTERKLGDGSQFFFDVVFHIKSVDLFK